MYEYTSLMDQPVNLPFALVLKTSEVTCVGRAATPVDLVEDASLTLIDPDAATVLLEIMTPTPVGCGATEPDCNDCSCLVAQLDADIRGVVKALLLNSINH